MKKRWLIFLILIPISAGILIYINPLEAKKKAGLQVITGDKKSSLFLNGDYLEKTPFINKKIQPGTYQLKIQPDDPNLVPYETSVELRKGLLTVITWQPDTRSEYSGGVSYELEPIANTQNAEISFVTIPDDAIIQFDNQNKEFSPLILKDIEPGHHEFSVNLPAYNPQKHTANAVAGHRLNITIKLARTKELVDTTNFIDVTNPKEASSEAKNQMDENERKIDVSPTPLPTLKATPTIMKANEKSSEEESSQQVIRIKSTNFFVDGKEVLKVRDQADSAGKIVAYAQSGKEYQYLGKTESNWFKVKVDEIEGWVSGQFAELMDK